MSTIEELQQACAEFSQNFAALSTKHETLGKELDAERALRKKIEGQLAAAVEEIGLYNEALKSQREGTEEALQYKERYYATCVAVEHLKGRLEVAKKALSEKDEEHEAEKEHLHAQMNDLLQRIDANSSATQIRTLKDRIVQLEEQCALLSGSTIEEKERVMQQQLLSNATVRDLQSKVATAEQRLRASEKELGQLRGMLRRCSDVQSELTLSNERLVSENNRLKTAAEEKVRDVQTAEKKAAGQIRTLEEQMSAAAKSHEKTLKQLTFELTSLKEVLDRKAEDMEREAERYGELRTTMTRRVNAAREESLREIEILQSAKNEALAEVQRLKWKATQDGTQFDELQASMELGQQRIAALERQLLELNAQIEASAQKESFVIAEREQLKQTIATMQLRLTEAQSHQQGREMATAEADRLRLQLQYTESELFETRRQLQDSMHRCRAVEIECDKKIKFMHKHIKSQTKKREHEVALNDELRRRLVSEAVFNAPNRGVPPPNQAATVPTFVQTGYSPDITAPSNPGAVDVLEVLRQQSKQATALQERLSALSR